MAAFGNVADPMAHDVARRGPQQIMPVETDMPRGPGASPRIAFSVDVLPAPLAPMMPTASLGPTSRLTSCTALTPP